MTHDRQGYPVDWTAEAEYEPRHIQHPNGVLHDLKLELNTLVDEDEWHRMIERSSLSHQAKQQLAATCSLQTLQERIYHSYWGLRGLTEEDCFGPMNQLQV